MGQRHVSPDRDKGNQRINSQQGRYDEDDRPSCVCGRNRMDERGRQGAEGLAEEASDCVGGPDGRTGEAVDSGRGGGIVLAEDRALHEDSSLRLGETIEPVAEGEAPGVGDEFGNLVAGKRSGVVIAEAGRDGSRNGHIGEGGRIVPVHDFESAFEDAFADQAFGGAGIGTGIDFNGRDGIFNQLKSFGLAAQHESSETVHFNRGALGTQQCFVGLTGTGGFRHGDTSGEGLVTLSSPRGRWSVKSLTPSGNSVKFRAAFIMGRIGVIYSQSGKLP
jgi:hypothetical protein